MSLRQVIFPPFLGLDQEAGAARGSIVLVDSQLQPLLGLYSTGGQPISGRTEFEVAAAEVSVYLTPQTEIAPESFYIVTTDAGGASGRYKVQIGASASPLTWEELIQLSDPLSPAELSLLNLHISDDGRHLPVAATVGQFAQRTADGWEPVTVAPGAGIGTSGTPVANDFARFTDADTLEGRSYAETKADLSLEDADINTLINARIAAMQSSGDLPPDPSTLVEGDMIAVNSSGKYAKVG